MTIWANCIIHNEENFIWFAIMSVVDFIDKVLVWDTGSTDKTVEIIKEIIKIKGDKIEFKEVGPVDKNEFTKMRQAMLDASKCDWILILDGDEIWWEESIKKVTNKIRENGNRIEGIVVPMVVPVGDIYHFQEQRAGQYELLGRKGHYSLRVINKKIPGLCVDWPYGKESYLDADNQPIQQRAGVIFLDAPYLHVTHLKRSSLKRSSNKFKFELGSSKKDFKYPEVFYKAIPSFVPLPWIRMKGKDLMFAKLLMPLRKIRRNLSADLIAWLTIIGFSAVYAFMSVVKHNSFQTFGWDLAVFDHGIWQWANFRIPYSAFHDLPWLADHFHLILVTLAPFYWIWSDVKVLLIVQAILVGFGALPLYYLSKKVTENNLFSFVVIVGYLLFYSLQSFIFSDFHELAYLPLTLGGVMLFWELRKTYLFWIFFMLALLVKEKVGLLLVAFGLWALMHDRKRRGQAILSIILGGIFTFGMVYFVMPSIGGRPYIHSEYGQSGKTMIDVLLTILKNPFYLISSFIDSPVKINTIWTTFWPWGFLPLFMPSSLILILEQFASRFLDYGKPIRWSLFFAYSLPMATIMAWGSIYGFNNLIKLIHKITKLSKYFLGIWISIVLFILIIASDLLLHGPINNILKAQFYYREKWIDNNLSILNCVPQNVSVAAQNSLAPWLSQRELINVFPKGIGSDYIVLDLHPGQSENSFSFLGSKNTKIVMDDLIGQGYYEPICQVGFAVALRRKINPPYDLQYSFKIIYDGI